jgi:multiple sugar transport system permease protein
MISDESSAGAREARQRAALAAPKRRRMSIASYVFLAPYLLLMVVFGVMPGLYALYLSFTSRTSNGSFVALQNFTKVLSDFRFMPAVQHVSLYLVFWLIALVILVTFFALVVHGLGSRHLRTGLRLVYYLPGALAGASSVMLWLFVLDPTASPVSILIKAMGMASFVNVIVPSHLPVIFAIIAFWTGAGGWIVIMYGALNNISTEVMEAARIDGAGSLRLAWHIQIPMIRKWISYMAIISIAAGVQLFVEPQLLSQASNAIVPNDYSLNQLAYLYAFKQNDFHGSAAISILLLFVALSLSAIFVTRGGLFDKD